MPSSTIHLACQLRQLIYYHLDNNLLRNALFLAGRLFAYEPRSPEAAYLLATCQFQSGQTKAAWDTTRLHATRGNHLGCCYVYAQASLELGRYVEGTTALERSKGLWQNRNTWNQHNETRRQHLPDAAAVHCLQGKLYKAHNDMGKAADCWAEALKMNPFMWDAFLGLCDAGAKVNIPNIYKMSPEMVAMLQTMQQMESSSAVSLEKPSKTHAPLQAQNTNHPNHSIVFDDPFMSAPKVNGSMQGSKALLEKYNGSKVSISTVSTFNDYEGTDTPTNGDFDEAPPLTAYSIGSTADQNWEPPLAPSRKAKIVPDQNAEFIPLGPPPKMRAGSIKSRGLRKGDQEEPAVLQDPPPPAAPSKRTVSGQPAQPGVSQPERRSTRLLRTAQPISSTTSKMSQFASSIGLREGRDIKKAKAPTTKSRIATTATVGRVVSGNRTRTGSQDVMDVDSDKSRHNSTTAPPVPAIPEKHQRTSRVESCLNREIEAFNSILNLLSTLAAAQLSLSTYDCNFAIQLYNSLPTSQRDTPYVKAQIGKAYYEQANYVEAERFFIAVKTAAPSRLEDMEVYSTVLWHLKNEVELAYLAHELSELERLSPQAWVAVGNSFSLQREHEQALKCFKRATQIDPSFAYGFTLQGHEFVANEEFEKALDAYRCAVAADGRHYNAWYGLGKVYEKMGKWETAETHYRTAARINPANAVLVACIGMVLEKQRKPEQALQAYTRACALAPTSALSRFKKARCLMGMGRPREALGELVLLKDIAPDEANVHFLLGRLYKMLRMRAEAVKAFTMALNLDPKAAQFIKDAMESLDDEDDEDEDEDGDMD